MRFRRSDCVDCVDCGGWDVGVLAGAVVVVGGVCGGCGGQLLPAELGPDHGYLDGVIDAK